MHIKNNLHIHFWIWTYFSVQASSLHFHFNLFLKVDDVEWLMHVQLLKYYEVLAGEEVCSLVGHRAHRMITAGLRTQVYHAACKVTKEIYG